MRFAGLAKRTTRDARSIARWYEMGGEVEDEEVEEDEEDEEEQEKDEAEGGEGSKGRSAAPQSAALRASRGRLRLVARSRTSSTLVRVAPCRRTVKG